MGVACSSCCAVPYASSTMSSSTVTVIEQVKKSCLESLSHSGIKLNEQGMRSFLKNLDRADWDKHYQEHGARFPLNYDGALDELNFLSILTILNFLSAYRIPLHKRTGQGAYDAVRRFVLSCYLSGHDDADTSPLTAKGMAGLSEAKTAEYLKLEIYVEKDHPTLPVKLGERDPEAVEIVGLVQKVMNETGEILLALKKKDLGAFVADVLREGKDDESRTDLLVEKLVETFPAFADEGTVKGHKVKVYKKAQLLAFIIGTEFAGRADLPFPLPSVERIPACVDNVLPTMAVHFDFLDLSECAYPLYKDGLGSSAAKGGEKVEGLKQSAEEAYAIRSATLAACERVVEIAKEVASSGSGSGSEDRAWLATMTAMNMDGYLWQKAKDGDLRLLPRLSERGTVFY